MVKKRNIKKITRRPESKKITAARGIKKKVQRKKPLKRKRLKESKEELKRKRQPSAIALARLEENPIISPKLENGWEAWQTFNPGVILLDNKVHILYRAIGSDGISRLGYAVSYDGFKIDERLSCPAYQEQLKKET